MPTKYSIPINENTIDLVTFLNDGRRPEIKDKPTVLLAWVQSPNEITTTVEIVDQVDEERRPVAEVVLVYR